MQVYKAIKYIRLSYTDDKTVESDSVANQRRLIDDYIARHPEIEVVAEKIDDGYPLHPHSGSAYQTVFPA